MSAAVLSMPQMRFSPQLWPTSITAAAQAVNESVFERRRPHCLRLVQATAEITWEQPRVERNPESGLAFYRKYTEAMLRRYMTISMEAGRVPSLLGRELFRSNVSNYKVQAFDDSVIFVHDVGNCVAALDAGLRVLVRRIALEGYTQEEAAVLLGVGVRTVIRRYGEALDKLTRMLLDRKMLEPMMASMEGNR